MDETNIPSRDDDYRAFQQLIAAADGPAYARRARRVHDAFEQLLPDAASSATNGSRSCVCRWAGCTPSPARGRPAPCLPDDESLELLRRLHEELQPHLRVPLTPTTALRTLKATLVELIDGLERFNCRWQEHVHGLDVQPINELRDGYNRYYVLEKECALRNRRGGAIRLSTVAAADGRQHSATAAAVGRATAPLICGGTPMSLVPVIREQICFAQLHRRICSTRFPRMTGSANRPKASAILPGRSAIWPGPSIAWRWSACAAGRPTMRR